VGHSRPRRPSHSRERERERERETPRNKTKRRPRVRAERRGARGGTRPDGSEARARRRCALAPRRRASTAAPQHGPDIYMPPPVVALTSAAAGWRTGGAVCCVKCVRGRREACGGCAVSKRRKRGAQSRGALWWGGSGARCRAGAGSGGRVFRARGPGVGGESRSRLPCPADGPGRKGGVTRIFKTKGSLRCTTMQLKVRGVGLRFRKF